MYFKPVEIIAIIVAFAIPIIAFGLMFIPGGMTAVVNFALGRQTSPYVFGGAAILVMAVLGFRMYRRVRPAPKKKRDADAAPSFFDFLRLDLWRDPNKD